MKIAEKLGQGAYGSVYKTEHKQKRYAVKRNIIDSHVSFHASLREVDIAGHLQGHPNVVKLEGISFSNPFDEPLSPSPHGTREDSLFLLFECADIDFYDILYKHEFNPSLYKKIIVQLLLGLEFIHAKNIIHRDIKPSNILYSQGQVKYCDFGLSKHHNIQNPNTPKVVTSWYRSPEAFSGNYDKKADVWSLGCIILEYLRVKPLFYCKEEEDLREKFSAFSNDVKSLSCMVNLSEEKLTLLGSEDYDEILSLCSLMLEKDPTRRPSATECLKHHYFSPYQDMIENSRKSHPPVPDHEISFYIYDIEERKTAVSAAFDVYNRRKDIPWYSDRIIFTSIMLFDRYLNYMQKKYPKGRNAQAPYKFHSERGVVLRYVVCLYISLKYHSTLLVPNAFDRFTGDIFSSYINYDDKETNDFALEFEKCLIQSVCSYKIYVPTPYERAHIFLDEEKVRLLLYYYGSVGECKTTARSLFTSWMKWET